MWSLARSYFFIINFMCFSNGFLVDLTQDGHWTPKRMVSSGWGPVLTSGGRSGVTPSTCHTTVLEIRHGVSGPLSGTLRVFKIREPPDSLFCPA